MDFSGWFLVNLLGPTLLPVLGTLPFLLFSHRLEVPRAGDLVMATVKDGQMCWAVIAMGASTIYEIWLAHGTVPFGGPALVISIVLMLHSMIVAACGAVFNTPPLATPAVSARAWISHYRVFVWSATLALLAAANYIYVHVARGLRLGRCMVRIGRVIVEPKPKKLWLKDGEAVKTFVSIMAVTTSAVGLLIILAAVLFG